MPLFTALAVHDGARLCMRVCVADLNFASACVHGSPMGSDCGLVNVNCGTSGAEIGGAFGTCRGLFICFWFCFWCFVWRVAVIPVHRCCACRVSYV